MNVRLVQARYNVQPHQAWHFEHMDGEPVRAGLFHSDQRALGYARERGWTIAEVVRENGQNSGAQAAKTAL